MMYGKNLDEIQLPMNFFVPDIEKLSASEFRQQIGLWDANPAQGWPVYLLSNHDRIRAYSRYADGINNDKIAKLLATMILTLRGTPILYYGEEIGMENWEPMHREDVKDPIGRIGWPKEKGRDGERTPMQWNDSLNAGFSTGHAWLPVALNYPTHNVFNESHDKNSILLFYEKLISLRSKNDALIHGSYTPVNENDPDVLSYLRKGKHESALVVLNMSKNVQNRKFDLQSCGVKATAGRVLVSSDMEKPHRIKLDSVILQPYEAMIIRLR
jgi:alpha-glucosidase